jgi:hypothetical protein
VTLSQITTLGSVLLGVGIGVYRLKSASSVETGVTQFGLLTRLRTTRHLWDGTLYLWTSLQVAVALFLLSVVLTWWVRNVRLAMLSGAGLLVSLGVIPIAMLKHVQANFMMPRYFSTTITLGLLLQFLVVVAMCYRLFERKRAMSPKKLTNSRALTFGRYTVLLGFTVTAIFVATIPLGFGLDYRDQSGKSKTGNPLDTDIVGRLGKLETTHGLPVLISLGFWDTYPTVFLLQLQRQGVLALDDEPIFDVHQKNFASVLASREFYAVCRPRFSTCVQGLGAALQDRGLRGFSIRSVEQIPETKSQVVEVLEVRPTRAEGR